MIFLVAQNGCAYAFAAPIRVQESQVKSQPLVIFVEVPLYPPIGDYFAIDLSEDHVPVWVGVIQMSVMALDILQCV